MSTQDAGSTIIGRGAKVRGDFNCTGDLVVDGEVEGTIRLTGGRLTIGPDARVRASVGAQDVVVFGRLEGDVRATGRVELRSSAVVLGNVFAARLAIEENAALRGQVDPTRAGEPLPVATPPAPLAAAARPVAAVQDSLPGAEPRKPDPFNPQTESQTPRSNAKMPAGLAAAAATTRSNMSSPAQNATGTETVDNEAAAGAEPKL